MKIEVPATLEEWNSRGMDCLPGLLGLKFHVVEPQEVRASFDVSRSLMAWNGFLHAGALVSLSDTCCGYGTLRSIPEGANGFTTLDLTSNFLGTALSGAVECHATPLHQGRTTQVWDAQLSSTESGRTIAHFRCTQLVLWPRS